MTQYKKEGKKPAKVWGRTNKSSGSRRQANKAVRKIAKQNIKKNSYY